MYSPRGESLHSQPVACQLAFLMLAILKRGTAAFITQRSLSASSRTRPLSLHQTLVDEIGTLQAVGLQGPIQAMRDFTQAAYAAMQPVVLPTLAMGLLFLGATAWREGSALRKKSSSAALNLRDFQLLALCLVLDFVGGVVDFAWAPISAALLLSAFDSPLLAAANALKELLPLTDVVPVATLSWLLAYVYPEARATHLLGLRRMDETAKGEDG